MERYFAFSSAGAYQVQGPGDWKIRADAKGNLTIEHSLFGAVTSFGPFQLLPEEAGALWKRIAAAAIEGRRSSPSRGSLDEAVLGFALFSGERLHNVQIWANEAFEDSSITPLVLEIAGLIEKYTGKKPVLR
jgi:hypothetical protein